jgi:5-methylcytosine-specific restriction endonuclease McrA
MNTNILTHASRLSDHELLDRIGVLAAKEREAVAELVAHLAALDARPSLYAALGYGSLFAYCTQVLRLSEDATCNRIVAARTCRRFPMMLDLLASGRMTLTSVRMLSGALTPENHEAVVARACGRSRREIEAIVAELAPRPDVAPSIRKIPTPALVPAPAPALPTIGSQVMSAPAEPALLTSVPVFSTRRPVIEATSPDRYRVQFTMGKDGHEKLRRLQALLRREIPGGDPGVIVDRALTLLLEKVEKQKLGAATRRPTPAKPASPRVIRSGADKRSDGPSLASRHIPAEIQRGVCQRDGDRCAFVSKDGHRCTERTFLEFHHIRPHALGGEATLENISLRCRRHNQYEAELVFGPHGASAVRETPIGQWASA